MVVTFLKRALVAEVWAGALAKLARKNLEEINCGRWVEVWRLQRVEAESPYDVNFNVKVVSFVATGG